MYILNLNQKQIERDHPRQRRHFVDTVFRWWAHGFVHWDKDRFTNDSTLGV